MMRPGDGSQDEITSFPLDPDRASIYAEGWQSWSVAGVLPVSQAPHRVTAPESVVIDCQYAAVPPAGVHRGSGLLAVDPGNGNPVEVFGALDADRRVPVIEARMRNGSLLVSADGPVAHISDAGPGSLTGSLSRWAEGFAALAGVTADRLRPIPPLWCSWYQYYGAVTTHDIVTNLAAMDTADLDVAVVQIDDGYQAAPGDWLAPSGRFDDLPGLVARIRASGRRAGIWIAPMLVGRASALLAAHPDWLVRDQRSGEPVFAGNVVRQECTALDLTHPAAASYLTGVLQEMRNWGVDYFKIDFAYAGAVEGDRHEPVTGVEAYRHALALIRSAIGPQPLLLCCGAPILPSVGLVDAMRVGPDIAATYEPPDGNPSMPSQLAATRNTVARAWQHGRFWVNDPDCLMVRPGVERREDWAATVQRFGGVRGSGDGLAGLDAWGLETTRRLLVPSPMAPFT
ncbi:MAG TPA: glycoside hydrolase family 36 protein [Streptosporangiaceae bacterium]|nr:glycoside hydrolase family 36 protein [Streptosporangiaceae bacterium]